MWVGSNDLHAGKLGGLLPGWCCQAFMEATGMHIAKCYKFDELDVTCCCGVVSSLNAMSESVVDNWCLQLQAPVRQARTAPELQLNTHYVMILSCMV